MEIIKLIAGLHYARLFQRLIAKEDILYSMTYKTGPGSAIKFATKPYNKIPFLESHFFRVLLLFSFGLVSIILFIRFISVFNADSDQTDSLVFRRHVIIRDVGNIKFSVTNAETAINNYIISNSESDLRSFHTEQKNMLSSLNEANSLVIDSTQKHRLKRLQNLINGKISLQQTVIKNPTFIVKSPGNTFFKNQNGQLSDSIESLIDSLIKRQNLLLGESLQKSKLSKTKVLTTAIVGMGFFFLFVMVTLFRLNTDIGRRKKAEFAIRESESKYRNLIEEAGVTIFTSNLNGKFTYVSNRCQQLTGFSADELCGKSYISLVPQEWVQEVATNYQHQAASLSKESLIEFPIITKNKEMKWVEQQAVLLFDEEGLPVGFQCTVKDVTEKKEAAFKLSKSQEISRALLNNTKEGIFIIDKNFQILLINKQATEEIEILAGKRPDTGMDFRDFILAGDNDIALQNFNRVFSGEKVDHEAEYATPAGMRSALISHSPVKDEQNNVTGAAVVTHDITEKKRQELKIKESEYRLRFTLEKLGDNFWEHDFITNTTTFSKSGYEFLGYEKDDFASSVNLWWENVHKDDRQMLEENDRKYREGEADHHSLEYRIICKNKSVKWVLDRGVVVEKTAEGKPLKKLGTHTDITRLKSAEEKIRESDQKIRAMLESNREGFYMVDFDYRILMINEAARNYINLVTGRNAKQDDNILEFILPQRRDVFTTTFEKIKLGHREEVEIELTTSAGQTWFHTRYFPVYGEQNEIIGLCASTKDITENKLIDNALLKIRAEREESQFRLQSILDNTPLIVFIKNLEGRYLVVNRSFREMVDLDEHEIIGKTDFDFETPRQALRYQQADQEVIRSLQSIEREETLRSESGTRNLLLVKFPLFDRKNNIYGVGGIATDYTDKVQYQQKLIKAKKIAESAEQLQEQFLANMSHEIRTPMNGIIGMTNILMNTSLNNEQTGYVNIIRESSDTLLFLINDILDLSKIKSGKLSIEKIPFKVREVLENAILPFQLKAKEKNIELKLVTDMRIPQTLEGDPHRLKQIVNNLLSNALKFTDKGFVSFVIEMNTQIRSKALIKFIVKDSGVGIPENKLNTIFNSFEQAANSTARKFGGTGLGLTITKQLVELQGGQIDVASIEGKGTEFTFEIPYTLVADQKIPVNDNLLVNDNCQDLTGKKILIAEDNEINQKVISLTLKAQGLLPIITNNGREAIELLEKGELFDLVILDLQMPEMNGYQTAIYIRKKLNLRIPIIAMTASALQQERTRCLELGMNEYITKPFSSETLFRHLRKFLCDDVAPAEVTALTDSVAKEYYNLCYLHEMDDKEYFCEVLQMFLDAMPTGIEELKEASLHENWELVNSKAHKMKSSLGLLQTTDMLEMVVNIETRAKEKQELDKIPAQLHKLSELYELLRPMIENELMTAKKIGA